MIYVAYCDVTDLDLNNGYNLVSNERQVMIDKFYFKKDKLLSCGAELLLRYLLKKLNITDPIFKRQKYGKPYISNYKNIYFNISHSENIVFCAVSDNKVGVDVEYIDETIDLLIAKKFFFNEEYETIKKSTNPIDMFFNLWVLKESFMKYKGLGFELPLNSFSISLDEKYISVTMNDQKISDIKFTLKTVNNFKLAVCSKNNISNFSNVNSKDLI